eukprot:760816-Hanusia_phi.AAC.1
MVKYDGKMEGGVLVGRVMGTVWVGTDSILGVGLLGGLWRNEREIVGEHVECSRRGRGRRRERGRRRRDMRKESAGS